MTGETPKRRLGRGLSALLGDPEADNDAASPEPRVTDKLPIEWLQPSPFQPRRRFDQDDMAGLVESIRDRGMLQPILVRLKPGDLEAYEIVAGERRWRAAQQAQLHDVPVIIKDLNDRDTLEIALIENLQRENLTPLEEAQAYSRLMREFDHTQEALGRSVGRSRSHVANTLRLLELPDEIKSWVDSGELSAGHARALLGTPDAIGIARKVLRAGLNVRQTEQLCQKRKQPTPAAKRKAKDDTAKDADTLILERDLSALLGLRVNIDFQGTGGSLMICFDHLEQLDDILQRLSAGAPGPSSDDDTGQIEDNGAEDAMSQTIDQLLGGGVGGPPQPGSTGGLIPLPSADRDANFLEIPAFLRER